MRRASAETMCSRIGAVQDKAHGCKALRALQHDLSFCSTAALLAGQPTQSHCHCLFRHRAGCPQVPQAAPLRAGQGRLLAIRETPQPALSASAVTDIFVVDLILPRGSPQRCRIPAGSLALELPRRKRNPRDPRSAPPLRGRAGPSANHEEHPT